MFNYRDQLAVISKIKIREGEHKTLDCPFCGGHKKFTIDRLAYGRLLWNCFRASCTVRGSKNNGRSVEAAKAYVAGNRKQGNASKALPLPALTTRIENSMEASEYIQAVNSKEAYENGLIDIRYDPRTGRVLFYNSDKSGAVGRALKGGPKWLSYGDTSCGIHVGGADKAVLVEDAASACAISRLPDFTGIALLGTNLTNTLKNTLHRYNKIYILLDNDATGKAAQMTRKIRGRVFLRTTDHDPKELGIPQLRKILRT